MYDGLLTGDTNLNTNFAILRRPREAPEGWCPRIWVFEVRKSLNLCPEIWIFEDTFEVSLSEILGI